MSCDIRLKVSATARVMRLRVDPRTGAVLLTVPRRVSRRRALAWAAEQSGWIDAQRAAVPPCIPLRPGAVLPVEGAERRIDWHPERPRNAVMEADRIVVGGPADGLERRVLAWLKRRALDVMSRETAEFATLAGVKPSRVGVGDPVSRWGSCASSGAIRYSWRLILTPHHVRRATVAHEVAHLVHMNHGPDFHALVERLLGGDSKPARLWLRRHGAGLHRIGRSE